MAIKQPSEMANIDKKIRVLIAGYPGIGKTTLSLSAPNPLHIDVDRGLDRVAAAHRHPFIQPENYEELLNDLQPHNLKDFETLVFDTGGQLLKLMGEWAKRENSKNGQKDGSLSLKGYGIVGKEFENLMNKAYYELKKHVIVIFHAKEKEENEVMKLRLMVDGQTKDNVWQPMDLGGFIQMQGKDRVITFENNERHFGKRCHGVAASMVIPDLSDGRENNLFTKLFSDINENIKNDAKMYEEQRAEYDKVMLEITAVIDGITDCDSAMLATEALKNIEHKMTSLTESKALFNKKLYALNLKYDKEKGCYVEKTPDNSLSA